MLRDLVDGTSVFPFDGATLRCEREAYTAPYRVLSAPFDRGRGGPVQTDALDALCARFTRCSSLAVHILECTLDPNVPRADQWLVRRVASTH